MPYPQISDHENIRPQFDAIREILNRHRLCWSIDDLAAQCAVKAVTITWQQVQAVLDGKDGHPDEVTTNPGPG